VTAAEKESVAKRLSDFTGLSVDYLLKADLRVTLGQFNIELQRSRGLTTGRIDARFSGYTRDLLSETSQGDPEGPAVGGAFTALLNAYNHNELKFGLDKTYLNNSGAAGEWNWKRLPTGRMGGPSGGFFPGAPNVMGDLVEAMITNPRLFVQVENGYYDMATPFFATEFTMDHLGLPADLRGRLTLDYYASGHMMYLHNESRRTLHDNIARFVDKATAR
jgi:carboxypeptidase C (cathepsin A)